MACVCIVRLDDVYRRDCSARSAAQSTFLRGCPGLDSASLPEKSQRRIGGTSEPVDRILQYDRYRLTGFSFPRRIIT